MKTLLVSLLFGVAVMTVGCAESETTAQEKAAAKDENEIIKEEAKVMVKLDQIVLLDVQGLHGGRDLWIAADGSGTCRVVRAPEGEEPGLQSTRYSVRLSKEQQAAIVELVKKHDYFSIKTSNRIGIPDEAFPYILIKSGQKTYAVGKWQSDKHPQFDPIYQALLNIVNTAKKGEVNKKGSYDMDWQPEGFPGYLKIWTLAKENYQKQ